MRVLAGDVGHREIRNCLSSPTNPGDGPAPTDSSCNTNTTHAPWKGFVARDLGFELRGCEAEMDRKPPELRTDLTSLTVTNGVRSSRPRTWPTCCARCPPTRADGESEG
jgi:hypothetical protein